MLYRICLLLLLAVTLTSAGLAASPQAHAQSRNSHYVFRQWLTATNNGDVNGAAQYLASNFSVTLPDGSQVAGATAGEQAIMALGTPITVASLTATAQAELDAQLQFGAGGATMAVVITGESGTIGSMMITAGSAATSTATPAPTSVATPVATATGS